MTWKDEWAPTRTWRHDPRPALAGLAAIALVLVASAAPAASKGPPAPPSTSVKLRVPGASFEGTVTPDGSVIAWKTARAVELRHVRTGKLLRRIPAGPDGLQGLDVGSGARAIAYGRSVDAGNGYREPQVVVVGGRRGKRVLRGYVLSADRSSAISSDGRALVVARARPYRAVVNGNSGQPVPRSWFVLHPRTGKRVSLPSRLGTPIALSGHGDVVTIVRGRSVGFFVLRTRRYTRILSGVAALTAVQAPDGRSVLAWPSGRFTLFTTDGRRRQLLPAGVGGQSTTWTTLLDSRQRQVAVFCRNSNGGPVQQAVYTYELATGEWRLRLKLRRLFMEGFAGDGALIYYATGFGRFVDRGPGEAVGTDLPPLCAPF